MVDLREKVVQDRGIIAKIQSMIPGFSGYRANEDIRAADSMLRIQLADRLAAVRKDLEACRATLADDMNLESLDRVGTLISRFKAIEGEVRHAEQGYSGISAKIRVGEAELNRLYEYDLNLTMSLAEISGETAKVRVLAGTGGQDFKAGLASLGAELDKFQADFRKRMTIVTGTEA
jgi:hypothetical protein